LKNKTKISLTLLASFVFTIAFSFILQFQLKAVGSSQAFEYTAAATHCSSSILSLVEESLEDTENRRAGFSHEIVLINDCFHPLTRQQSFAHYFYYPDPALTSGNLYLEFCRLLI